jgi:hypothetical protein
MMTIRSQPKKLNFPIGARQQRVAPDRSRA